MPSKIMVAYNGLFGDFSSASYVDYNSCLFLPLMACGLAFSCQLCYSGGGQMAGSNRLRWVLDSRLLVQGWAAIFFIAVAVLESLLE